MCSRFHTSLVIIKTSSTCERRHAGADISCSNLLTCPLILTGIQKTLVENLHEISSESVYSVPQKSELHTMNNVSLDKKNLTWLLAWYSTLTSTTGAAVTLSSFGRKLEPKADKGTKKKHKVSKDKLENHSEDLLPSLQTGRQLLFK